MSQTTKRQQIVDKLKLRLARISVANGFQTDIGSADVEEWPTEFNDGQLREATRLGVFDRDEEMTQSQPEEGQIPVTLPFQVRIFHSAQTTPAKLRLMLADVMKAIIEHEVTGERDARWRDVDEDTSRLNPRTAIAVDTKPLRAGFVIPQSVFTIDAGAVEFQVEFMTEPFNAFE